MNQKYLPLLLIAASLFANTNSTINLNSYLNSYYDKTGAIEIKQIIKKSSNGKCIDNEKNEFICTMPIEEFVKIIEQDSIKEISVLKFSNTESELGGVGLSVQEKPKNTFKIFKVFKGSPAEKELQIGDELLEIDDVKVNTLTLEDTIKKLKGKPGTSITIKVLRNKKILTKNILRDVIRIQDDEMIVSDQDGNLQIAIEAFDLKFSDKLVKIMLQKHPKKLTIDLRNSAGGNFKEILSTLSIFLPLHTNLFYSIDKEEKEIHSIQNYKYDIEYNKKYEKIITTIDYKNEIEIIVDETTHAGSLLFTYVMKKYYNNCKIIGNDSGKIGYLYIAAPLPNSNDDNINYVLKIATGQFYTMDGEILSGKKLFDLIKDK